MTNPNSDKFHWAKRAPRRDIQRLYESEAVGRLNEELLDKVSGTIYARVADMLEVMQAQKRGVVTCRNCGKILLDPFRMGTRNKNNLLHCQECGWTVTCGEFYDSYTGERMLPGSVPQIFLNFIERWTIVHTPQEKMLLIDWLIHQFHMNQGIAGRPVGENVIQGTARQVSELIAGLADGKIPGMTISDDWLIRYNNPIRLFRQRHSYAEVLKMAAELGIQGRSTMSEDILVAEILRLAPELFDAKSLNHLFEEGQPL